MKEVLELEIYHPSQNRQEHTDNNNDNADINETSTTTISNCYLCHRTFKTSRGLLQHLKYCKNKNGKPTVVTTTASVDEHEILSQNRSRNNEQTMANLSVNFKWNNTVDGTIFTNELNEIYDEIVHWRRNLFLLPSGSTGKNIFMKSPD